MRHLATLFLLVSLGTFGGPLRPANVAMHWSPNPPVPVDVEADVSSWCFTGSNGDDCTDNFDFTLEYGNPSYASASTPKGYQIELDGDDCLREEDANYIHDQGAASAFTITGWFSNDAGYSEVLAINNTWLDINTILLFELVSDGDYTVRLRAGAATDTYHSDNLQRYVSGRWTFFAVSYDDTDDAVILWIDNTTDQSSLAEAIDTTHSTGGTIPQCIGACASKPVDSSIGCRNGGTNGTYNNYFTGDIADIRLFDSALSETDIEDIRDDR